MEFDKDLIIERKSPITPIIITNMDKVSRIDKRWSSK